MYGGTAVGDCGIGVLVGVAAPQLDSMSTMAFAKSVSRICEPVVLFIVILHAASTSFQFREAPGYEVV